MNSTDPTRPILRILVALDSLPVTGSGLDALAALAGGMEAELLGLFVEDARLLELAALPFSREVITGNASHRQLEPERLQRQMRAQASQARELLVRSATRLHAHHSFRVTRGEIVQEVLDASRQVDTVVVGLRHWSAPGVQRLVTESARTVLLLRDGWGPGRSVVVLYEDTPTARSALLTAARVARGEDLELCVLVPQRTGHGPARTEREIAEQLRGHARSVRFRPIGTVDPALIGDLARAEGARLLVLPADAMHLDRHALQALMDRGKCSLAFAR